MPTNLLNYNFCGWHGINTTWCNSKLFASARFYEVKNSNELKNSESVPFDITTEEYETNMPVENNISLSI